MQHIHICTPCLCISSCQCAQVNVELRRCSQNRPSCICALPCHVIWHWAVRGCLFIVVPAVSFNPSLPSLLLAKPEGKGLVSYVSMSHHAFFLEFSGSLQLGECHQRFTGTFQEVKINLQLTLRTLFIIVGNHRCKYSLSRHLQITGQHFRGRFQRRVYPSAVL